MLKVFLGGTTCDAPWRVELTKVLDIPVFNPVVRAWTEECRAHERTMKEECNIHFYCITSEMTGVFSIAEVIDSVHEPMKRTILQVIPDGFDEGQLRSLKGVVDMVNDHGGIAYIDSDLYRSARVLNTCFANRYPL